MGGKNVINPDSNDNAGTVATVSTTEEYNWRELKELFSGKGPEEVFAFTNAQMISYFVERTVTDGKPASDVKAMNKSALSLFQCGHIQDIKVSQDSSHLRFQAKCIPEM